MSADRIAVDGADHTGHTGHTGHTDRAGHADRAGIAGIAGIAGARAGIDDADRPDPPDRSELPACVEVDPADREFTATLERLGIEMPRDLAPGVLAGYRGLRAKMELLRTTEATDG
ncbi:hypothetical protein ACIBSV_43230 [Embleya sp. NPDC050154]|uniref:hypothetical protein n=1 Tax=Embleya sp. NPDC050154 TaxID=3363988 RepID=UPI003787F1D4